MAFGQARSKDPSPNCKLGWSDAIKLGPQGGHRCPAHLGTIRPSKAADLAPRPETAPPPIHCVSYAASRSLWQVLGIHVVAFTPSD